MKFHLYITILDQFESYKTFLILKTCDDKSPFCCRKNLTSLTKMSALTTEWQLKTGENSIKYTVVVEDFRQKINSFEAGRSIFSKKFKVSRSVFQLGIIPSGRTRNSRDVGVSLYNVSDWDVLAEVTFEAGDCKEVIGEERFRRGAGWGFAEFVPHERCYDGDLLKDGAFKLDVFVKIGAEQVLPHHEVEDEVISKMKSIDQKIGGMEEKFNKIDQRLATLEAGKYNLALFLSIRLTVQVVPIPAPVETWNVRYVPRL